MKKLSIIGCGKVGKTLSTLWLQHGQFSIGDILDLSFERASQATAYLRAGRAVTNFSELQPVDVYLIATPDQSIADSCHKLAACGVLKQGSIVFHCSGAAPSSVLRSAKTNGAAIASVHPIKSFADPEQAAATFTGTYCGIEGSKPALELLRPALEAIGGIPLEIDPEQKAVYHAATVFVSNYLTALVEIGGQALEKSGLTKTAAIEVIEPIVRGTVENIFKLGTVQALTGPIARGDVETVGLHLEALGRWNRRLANIYRQLGAFTLELAHQQGAASADQLETLSQSLEKSEE
jgi:predicted short-subunit dehydrogenase-like oxidoreductase (DUF2520 family)